MSLRRLGFWYVSRIRHNSAIHVLHCFYEQGETFDGLVFLGTKKGARPQDAVRLVRFRMHGLMHTYITNVLDPHQLSMQDIAQLYARRWDIECAFLLLKKHLGLALFWSAKPHVLLQQVWGTLILAQLWQALRLQIAVQAQQDPYDVSMALLIEYLPTLSDYHPEGLGLLLTRGADLGFIRPSSRIRIQTPDVSALLITPLPEDLVLEQVPNYPPDPGKNRKRSPKKSKKSKKKAKTAHEMRPKKRASSLDEKGGPRHGDRPQSRGDHTRACSPRFASGCPAKRPHACFRLSASARPTHAALHQAGAHPRPPAGEISPCRTFPIS
jgi:hypothetical protein